MNNESKNAEPGDARQNGHTGGNASGPGDRQPTSANMAPSAATSDFTDPAKHRRERIKKLEARLQREIARDNTATRKERDGQLFVWGAMVEGVYRDGNAHEREQLRQWAKRKLTDRRHLKRAECGFARIEDEAAEPANA